MSNDDVRSYLKENDVYIWEVANVLGIHETTLVKRLRVELDTEYKQNIYLAVEQILLDRRK